MIGTFILIAVVFFILGVVVTVALFKLASDMFAEDRKPEGEREQRIKDFYRQAYGPDSRETVK